MAAILRSSRYAGLYLCLTLIALVFIGPYLLTFFAAFKPESGVYGTAPWSPPHSLYTGNFRTVLVSDYFLRFLENTAGVTIVLTIGQVTFGVLAAYAFARLEFRGRELIFTLFLAALTLPTQVSAVPEFVVVKYMHLLNTQLSLIIPALIQVIAIFLLRQHFRTIPTELDDAARVDGAGHLRIIRHVIMPMSWPAISAVMVITGQAIWNDFFWPNLFINTTSRMTAPLALYNVENAGGGGFVGAVFAGLTILCLPCVLIFILLQRRLMAGIGYRGISR